MRLKVIGLVLLSGLLAYSGYWIFLSMNAGVFLDEAKPGLANHGVVFNYEKFSVSGFPYRLELRFEKPVMEFRNGALSYKIEAKTMVAVTHPWSLNHFILFPEKASAIFAVGQNREISLFPEKTSISLSGLKEDEYRVSIVMEDVDLTSNFEIPKPGRFKTLATHIRKVPKSKGSEVPLFEPKLLEIVFEGETAKGRKFLLSSAFLGQDVPEVSRPGLEAWQQEGGTFEIEEFTFAEEADTVIGNGSLTLDEDLRLQGTVGLKGPPVAMLSLFEQSGLITPLESGVLQGLISSLPQIEENEISLPLTFQGGYFLVGPLPVLEIDPIIRE